MEVTYTLAPADLESFQKFLKKRGSVSSFLVYILMIPIMIGMFALQLWAQNRTPHRVLHRPHSSPLISVLTIALPALLIFIFWMVIFTVSRRANRKKQGSDPMFTTSSTLKIAPENLHQSNAGTGTSTLLWTAIQEIGRDEKGLYFLLSENTGYIAPLRAFESEERAQQFFETAQRFWKIARGEELDPPIPAPPKPI